MSRGRVTSTESLRCWCLARLVETIWHHCMTISTWQSAVWTSTRSSSMSRWRGVSFSAVGKLALDSAVYPEDQSTSVVHLTELLFELTSTFNYNRMSHMSACGIWISVCVCGLCRYKNRSVLSYHYYCWLIDQQTVYEHYKLWQRVACDDVMGPLVKIISCYYYHVHFLQVKSCENCLPINLFLS